MKTWERALVTGASGGIGRAIAEYLGASGSEVILVARNEEELQNTARAAPERMQIRVADLSKTKDVESLTKFLEREPVDLLVNNAGIWRFGPFETQKPLNIRQMLDVNIAALTKLCHGVIPKMVENGKGDILNVSSIAGGQPLPNEALYAATKAFVTSFSQGLYTELKPHGVTVTALLPGLVRTNLFVNSEGGSSVEKVPEFMWMDPWEVAEIGLKAVSEGKPICVPGSINKTLSSLVQVTPQPILRFFSGQAMKYRAPKTLPAENNGKE